LQRFFRPAARQRKPACPALLQHTFPRLQDEKPQPLCQYAGKVLLVVNTASFCGFTPQYEGLEKLHARYAQAGLVVLGFPSNDFAQESGSNKEIADFCENTFGVKFPMFGKSAVRGKDANPLFRALAAQSGGRAPLWNFHKYLVGRDGRVVDNYSSLTKPDDALFIRVVERELARR
jgi:glutathione peroxidase